MLQSRLDLKCGKGAIPAGKQCHKGTATTVEEQPSLTAGAFFTPSAKKPKRSREINLNGLKAAALIAAASARVAQSAHTVKKQSGESAFGIAQAGAAMGAGLGALGAVQFIRGRNRSGVALTAGALASTVGGVVGATRVAEGKAAKRARQYVSGYTGSDPFKDLGVPNYATQAEIRRAYLRKAQEAHPDRGGTAEQMAKINAAYQEALLRIGASKTTPRARKPSMKAPRALPKADAASRLDKKCGGSGIAEGKKCHKGGSWPSAAVIGTALTAGGIAAFALSRRGSGKSTSTPERGTPQLPGLTPRALLAPAKLRKSKTQRMRENTRAAMGVAEQRIGQTAREEIRRVAQIGNTMAAAGEASGMAAKTTLRELRLRTEAARRRYEPGYRSPDQRRLPGGVQAQLPASGLSPERVAIPFNPRTGQPRRKQARGFARRDGLTPGKFSA